MQPTEEPETGNNAEFHPGLFLRRAHKAFEVIHGTVTASAYDATREKAAISAAVEVGRLLLELGVEINTNLNRAAVAHETMATLAQLDVQAMIDEAIKAGTEDAANRKVAETTKRSYIGKNSG